MDGDRKARLEMQVALYAEAKRPFYGCKLGQTDAAKFGEAEAEIAKTEQRVAIGVEFAQKRGRGTCRIQQFHNGKMVMSAPAAPWASSRARSGLVISIMERLLVRTGRVDFLRPAGERFTGPSSDPPPH
ncbi:hypothetical protein X765_14795 [Mesorhizobium sp. LSHC440B00]|nr:hypothetical protein X765_14795 [Mesorhizobium sp. LSHC440B00]ESX43309.1 hypothetical protein X764_08580 [Mesorhizobium sp. LSHC440A00]